MQLSSLRSRYPLFLANRPTEATASLAVTDKFSGEAVTEVALADCAMIEAAFEAAEAARPALAAFPPYARRDVLRHVAQRCTERRDELAYVVAVEAGKPLRDARGEVDRLIDTFGIASEEATRVGGEVLNLEIGARSRGYRGFTKLVPIGVASFLTPFNFPLNLVAHKVAPAIAAGCPFVLKPSERTPVSALLLGELLAETSLPPGAFSILPARLTDALAFVEDRRIRLLSFTGSDKVGWDLKARAGRAKVVLELGGNAACIVDADQGEHLDHVADRLAVGAFYQSGQSCISVQRVLVHASLADALTDRLVARARALTPGDPKLESTSLGPMIDEAAAARLESWVASAVKRGARVRVGGARKGAMFEATVLDGVPSDEPLVTQEAFGPVALVSTWTDWRAALDEVNASPYGLQAGVFTESLQRAMDAWGALEVGGVVVGDVPSFRGDGMPYGGVKASGLGREGVKSAIGEMSETRLLVLKDG